MLSYQIQQSSLRCARSGRELQPGEKFFSVLYDRPEGLVREDVSKEAWQGPPADAYSFWMAKAPPKEQSRKIQVDDEVLLACLNRLADETEQSKLNFRYVLALLLMRRKRLKFEDVAIADGAEYLVLRETRTRATIRILNPQLTEQQIGEVQAEVLKVLGL